MPLNHPQMLYVFMRLEIQIARKEFDDDAANRPYVTRVAPFAAAENDLGCPILSGVDDPAVVLSFISGTTKIDYPYGVVARYLHPLWLVLKLPDSLPQHSILEEYIFGF